MGRYDILLNKEIAPVAVKKKVLPDGYVEIDLSSLPQTPLQHPIRDYDNRYLNRIERGYRVQEVAYSQVISNEEIYDIPNSLINNRIDDAIERAKQTLLNEIAQRIEFETYNEPHNHASVVVAKIELAVRT